MSKRIQKAHIHEEQFDGHLHAACARLTLDQEDAAVILMDEAYHKLHSSKRCVHCDRIEFPHGGRGYYDHLVTA